MSNLCQDLIAEIFAKLPVKSLLRFRCLSKSWRSLISRPNFIRIHALRFRSPQKLLIRHPNFYWQIYAFHPQFHRSSLSSKPSNFKGVFTLQRPLHHFHIVGSSNGIICLCDYQSCIRLWNPSIKRLLDLPTSFFNDVQVALGFGFDSSTDGYKVVKITYSKYNGAAQKQVVYNMKTGDWSPIASSVPPFHEVRSPACFFNGSLHWFVVHYLPECVERYIMTFDLSSEVFGTIKLSNLSPQLNHGTVGLTVVRDSLAVFCSDSSNFLIEVMTEYNNPASWTVIYKLDTLKLGRVDEVLQLPNNENLLVNTWYGWFEVDNPAMGALSTIVKFGDTSYGYKVETYMESLELLNEGRTCATYEYTFGISSN